MSTRENIRLIARAPLIRVFLHDDILNETSKPPLNIFSNILTHMIHKWLQFTLNMGKSIKLNLSKFNF